MRKCFMNVSGAASVTNRRRRREDAAGIFFYCVKGGSCFVFILNWDL